MSKHYVLEGRKAVPVDLLTWARWLEVSNDARVVAQDNVGGIKVSTVFLGLDHSYGNGPPLIFETMVFGGPLDSDTHRYSTWDESEAGHKSTLARVVEAGSGASAKDLHGASATTTDSGKTPEGAR